MLHLQNSDSEPNLHIMENKGKPNIRGKFTISKNTSKHQSLFALKDKDVGKKGHPRTHKNTQN
jgi:hypothetical protein